MQCFRCLRTVARLPMTAATATASTPRPAVSAFQQSRSISILSPRRPQLLPLNSTAIPHPSPTTSAVAAPEAPDVLPKVSAHPALQGIQVRSGPRATYKPSNLVRKRRHGFLSRIRTRKGRATLTRRKTKKRNSLSH